MDEHIVMNETKTKCNRKESNILQKSGLVAWIHYVPRLYSGIFYCKAGDQKTSNISVSYPIHQDFAISNMKLGLLVVAAGFQIAFG